MSYTEELSILKVPQPTNEYLDEFVYLKTPCKLIGVQNVAKLCHSISRLAKCRGTIAAITLKTNILVVNIDVTWLKQFLIFQAKKSTFN